MKAATMEPSTMIAAHRGHEHGTEIAEAVDEDPGRHRGHEGHGPHDADDGCRERLRRTQRERPEHEDRHDRAQADGEEGERHEHRPQDGFEHMASLVEASA
jgi:hypothetical protein